MTEYESLINYVANKFGWYYIYNDFKMYEKCFLRLALTDPNYVNNLYNEMIEQNNID